MDYAIQMLIPVLGGLMLGVWLNKTYGLPQIWTVILAVLGMVAGIAIMYRRFSTTPVDPKTIKLHSDQRRAARKAHNASQNTAHIKDLDFLYKEHPLRQDDWKELDEMDDEVDFGQAKTNLKDDSERHDL